MVPVSDTVLALKWRPKNFSELVGQTHVMQALSNGLDQRRLHHAYLFTGTRGVGKTTIARIFSKALNCEQGVNSQPCGVCSVCKSIDEGRFVDLIEVDAASKTKVEDTRELLENVQYAPVQGRYKVYLIDEVHMLSKSSFNALLKTLEEPPEHVKFLLATTDPHKLPMTVLSRCLQFNLMRLTQTQLQQHLSFILNQEGIRFEDAALAMIAKSADGSARDALSILDQAIAYGAGEVQHLAVQAMLGLVDQQFSLDILQALAQDSAEGIKQVVSQLASMGVDYVALNAQLIESFHYLSMFQVLGETGETHLLETEVLQSLAQQFSPERVQMCYQIALLAKQDMTLAPDIRIGFEMALIRMLAFQFGEAGEVEVTEAKMTRPGENKPEKIPEKAIPTSTAETRLETADKIAQVRETLNPPSSSLSSSETETTASTGQAVSNASSVTSEPEVDPMKALRDRLEKTLKSTEVADPVKPEVNSEVKPKIQKTEMPPEPPPQPSLEMPSNPPLFSEDATAEQPGDIDQPIPDVNVWMQLIAELGLDGMAAELARQSILVSQTPQVMILSVDPDQAPMALTELAFQRLEEQIKAQLGCRLDIIQYSGEHWTPAKQAMTDKDARQQQARNSIEQDATVESFKQVLNLNVIESSIQPK